MNTIYFGCFQDVNTLESTLQAALLRKDVYAEFTKVVSLFDAENLKDQVAQKWAKTLPVKLEKSTAKRAGNRS